MRGTTELQRHLIAVVVNSEYGCVVPLARAYAFGASALAESCARVRGIQLLQDSSSSSSDMPLTGCRNDKMRTAAADGRMASTMAAVAVKGDSTTDARGRLCGSSCCAYIRGAYIWCVLCDTQM